MKQSRYVGGILVASILIVAQYILSMMLLVQHWLVILMGLISAVLIYTDIQAADREGVEKFGDEYHQYMQRVPHVNFILGVVQLLQRKGSFDGRTPN